MIIFACVVVLIRLPFDMRSKRSSMKTGLLAPQLKRLKEKHGENTPKYNEEVQKLYKEENINPLSGCLWTLIPLVIVIILYNVVRSPLTYMMGLTGDQITLLAETLNGLGVDIDVGSAWKQIYIAQAIPDNLAALQAVVPDVTYLSLDFFGGINLGNVPKWNFFMDENWTVQQLALFILPILSVAISFVSQKLTMATSFQQQDATQNSTMKTMMFISPLISLYIGFAYPAALSLYWLAQNTLTTVINFFVNSHFKKIYDEELAIREENHKQKEAEIEAKRIETERLKALGVTNANKNTSKKKVQKTEKQKEKERLAAIEKEARGAGDGAEEPSRVGNRRYAKGRAFAPDRFDTQELDTEEELSSLEAAEEENAALEALEAKDDAVHDEDADFDYYEDAYDTDMDEDADDEPDGEYSES